MPTGLPGLLCAPELLLRDPVYADAGIRVPNDHLQ